MDWYINGTLKWGFEAMRQGDSPEDHFTRFLPGGKYASLKVSDFRIVDFQKRGDPDQSSKISDPNIVRKYVRVVFSPDFAEVTVYIVGKEPIRFSLQL